MAMLTAAAEMGAHGTANKPGTHPNPQKQSPASAFTQRISPHLSVFVDSSLPTTDTTPLEPRQGTSKPRSLNSVDVSGVEIDELFDLSVCTIEDITSSGGANL